MKTSDENLVELLREDPQQGYIQLVSQYMGFVHKIAGSKLSTVCSKEDIEELVSDIFYDFYCNWEKVDLEKGSIKALLSVITKRRAINRFHKATGQVHVSLYDESLQHMLVDGENVEQNVVEAERRGQLVDAIKELGLPDSEILIRKHYLGQTLREISAELGLKAKTVEKRYERALKKLRIRMGGDWYEG